MNGLPFELRDLISAGPMAHLSTINADGSPQVTVVWIGPDGDALVSGHLSWRAKLRNIERDPRPRAVIRRAAGARRLLERVRVVAGAGYRSAERGRMGSAQRLAKVYMSSDTEFPAPKVPGYVVRYSVERIEGVGPSASTSN